MMRRTEKAGSTRWTVGCEADNLLQDLFESNILYHRKKLRDTPAEGGLQPINVFNRFLKFHENHNSAGSRTHWNNELSVRGIQQTNK